MQIKRVSKTCDGERRISEIPLGCAGIDKKGNIFIKVRTGSVLALYPKGIEDEDGTRYFATVINFVTHPRTAATVHDYMVRPLSDAQTIELQVRAWPRWRKAVRRNILEESDE